MPSAWIGLFPVVLDHLGAQGAGLAGVACLVPFAAEAVSGTAWSEWLGWLEAALQMILHQVLAGYRQAPALMLGLAVALALPFLAIAGVIARWCFGRRRDRVDVRAATGGNAGQGRPAPSAWQQSGWLELEEPSDCDRFPVGQDLTRIGRAEDNDVRLQDASIHRYHAVVERSPEMLFTVIDVSGYGGNGVRVRGEAVQRSSLADGDIVEVGKIKLRFRLVGGNGVGTGSFEPALMAVDAPTDTPTDAGQKELH